MELILNDFGFLKKSGRKRPAHPDFGLMSGSPQPLLASHFRSERFRLPLRNPSPHSSDKKSERYISINTNGWKSCGGQMGHETAGRLIRMALQPGRKGR